MEDIYIYNDFFSDLSINMKNGDYAPHKPILLISIMDLVLLGKLTSFNVSKGTVLIKYFEHNWNRYIGNDSPFRCDINYPFKHLDSEAFWNNTSSNEAEFDEELFDLMKEKTSYFILKRTLIQTYIPQSIAKFDAEVASNRQWPIIIDLDSQKARQRTPPKELKIKMNGIELHAASPTDLLIDVIKAIGIKKVAELEIISCGFPLLDTKIHEKYGRYQKFIGEGFYINTCNDTINKKRYLDRIASALNLNISTTVIDSYCLPATTPQSEQQKHIQSTIRPEKNNLVPNVSNVNKGQIRGPRQQIEVKMNGSVIDGENPTQILINLIKAVGIKKVAELGLICDNNPLLFKRTGDNAVNGQQSYIGEGYFINTHSGTSRKCGYIQRIASALNIDISIKSNGVELINRVKFRTKRVSEQKTIVAKHEKPISITDNHDNKAVNGNSKKRITRRGPKILEVKMNGINVVADNPTEILIKVIKAAGIERVANLCIICCKHPLLDTIKNDKYGNRQREIGNGYFLNTCNSTATKKMYIEYIASKLNLDIKVRILD